MSALPRTGPEPMPPQATTTGLPSYALYGERGRTSATDWLHIETIASRSQHHGWEIKPHRHGALYQILYIRQGQAQVWLESGSLGLQGPALLLVPALVPHGFQFSPSIDGCVLTVLEQHLARLAAPVPALAVCLQRAQPLRLTAAGADAAAVAQAVEALQAEFAATHAFRDLALDAGLLALLVLLARLLQRQQAAPAPPGLEAAGPLRRPGQRALGHVLRLRAMVEAHFRQQPTMALLAAQIGITPTQLNRVCMQVLGHPALVVLHSRLVLEAQRELTYTTLSVKQVGHGLGFADAGYFSRFFRHHSGHSPSAWRALTANTPANTPANRHASTPGTTPGIKHRRSATAA